jgi:hypothetical protein
VTCAVVLYEGSHVPPAADCCHYVAFCVPVEGCGATCFCCATSHHLKTFVDLKCDVDFVVSSKSINTQTSVAESAMAVQLLQA